MQVCGPEVFMPAEVIISISDDGKDFTELKHIEHKVVKDDKVTFTNLVGKVMRRDVMYVIRQLPASLVASCLQMKL